MVRALVISLGLVAALGCSKEKKPAPKQEATLTTGTVTDGVRRIEVEAGKEGYNPERIAGKPGEKLLLVFKRTVEGECLRELKTPDGKLIELEMNKPIEVPVTLPDKGELTFACGMDMFRGTLVVEPQG